MKTQVRQLCLFTAVMALVVAAAAAAPNNNLFPPSDWVVHAGATIQYRSPLIGVRADQTLYNASTGSNVFLYMADAIALRERATTLLYGVDRDARGCRLSVREFSSTSGAYVRTLYQAHIAPGLPCERDAFVANAASVDSAYGVRQQWMCALESINRLVVFDPVAAQLFMLRLNDGTTVSSTGALRTPDGSGGNLAFAEPLSVRQRLGAVASLVPPVAVHCNSDGADNLNIYVAMQWLDSVFEVDSHTLQQSATSPLDSVPYLRRLYVPRPRWLQLLATTTTTKPQLSIVSNTQPAQVWRYDLSATAALLPTIVLHVPAVRRLSSLSLDGSGRYVLAQRAEIDSLFAMDRLDSSAAAIHSSIDGQRGILVGPLSSSSSSSMSPTIILGAGQWGMTWSDSSEKAGALLEPSEHSTVAAMDTSALVQQSSGLLMMDQIVPMTGCRLELLLLNNKASLSRSTTTTAAAAAAARLPQASSDYKPLLAVVDSTLGIGLYETGVRELIKLAWFPLPFQPLADSVQCFDERVVSTIIIDNVTGADTRRFIVAHELLFFDKSSSMVYLTALGPSSYTTSLPHFSVASSNYVDHSLDIVWRASLANVAVQERRSLTTSDSSSGLSAAVLTSDSTEFSLCFALDNVIQCAAVSNATRLDSVRTVFVCPTLSSVTSNVALLWQAPSTLIVRCDQESGLLYALELTLNQTVLVSNIPTQQQQQQQQQTGGGTNATLSSSSSSNYNVDWQMTIDADNHMVIAPQSVVGSSSSSSSSTPISAASDICLFYVDNADVVKALKRASLATANTQLPWSSWPSGDPAVFDQLVLVNNEQWLSARRAVDGLRIHRPHTLPHGLLVAIIAVCICITLATVCFMCGTFGNEVIQRRRNKYLRYDAGRTGPDERRADGTRLMLVLRSLGMLRTVTFYALCCVPELWRYRADKRIRQWMLAQLHQSDRILDGNDVVPTYEQRWHRPMPVGGNRDGDSESDGLTTNAHVLPPSETPLVGNNNGGHNDGDSASNGNGGASFSALPLAAATGTARSGVVSASMNDPGRDLDDLSRVVTDGSAPQRTAASSALVSALVSDDGSFSPSALSATAAAPPLAVVAGQATRTVQRGMFEGAAFHSVALDDQ